MFGAVAKTYYAEKMGIDPRRLVVVSIMPCTAKKFECKRPEMQSAYLWWKEKMNLSEKEAFFDVDYVLTTRELARMFKMTGVDFKNLPDEDFDHPLGISTGAGAIFAATGGVMEAAVRTAYEVVAGKPLPDLDLKVVRGFDGIKEAELDINGTKLKVAVAHTLKNARVLLDQIEEGKSPYAFIEVMTCPGGCLGGGGQPIPTTWEIRQKRANSIYREDSIKPLRKSHDNPAIKELYDVFLKEPLGHVSHELLHTDYTERGIY
jgi:NADH-quinone oxidoreductase subunit G/NADP-reducing hydrogenase subunit HndD